MQPFALRRVRIAHRYRAQLFHGAARLLDHFADVGAWQHSNELEAFGINLAIVMAPVVISPAHGSAKLHIFDRHP